jgi:hypothetical protein
MWWWWRRRRRSDEEEGWLRRLLGVGMNHTGHVGQHTGAPAAAAGGAAAAGSCTAALVTNIRRCAARVVNARFTTPAGLKARPARAAQAAWLALAVAAGRKFVMAPAAILLMRERSVPVPS